jgi:tRNA (guanosine-2'-O-)-methyltransferase
MTVQEQTELLRQYVSSHKQDLFERILAKRTRFLTVVMEDTYVPQNSSAVIRTCECVGIQDVYFIEKKHEVSSYKDVLVGSEKWISTHFFREKEGKSVSDCLNHLKANGYKILATTLDDMAVSEDSIDFDAKTAFVFGSEQYGISEEVKREADQLIKIPMYGFTDSFNLSVSAGILLHNFMKKIRDKNFDQFGLTKEEKDQIRLGWYKNAVKSSDLIIQRAIDGKGA